MTWRQLRVVGPGIIGIANTDNGPKIVTDGPPRSAGNPILDGIEFWDDDVDDVARCRVDLGPDAVPWAATGALVVARELHSITVLPDGRALVAGGGVPYPAAETATCELYDPATGAWTATGVLAQARCGHTATLLADGRVLVAGGVEVVAGELTACELYDLSTGTWAPAGALNNARSFHNAVLLQDGRVLVVGGESGGALASCEIYNPATNAWTVTGVLGTARDFPGLALLASGFVLVVGGMDGLPGVGNALATCELYNPATGLWAPTGSLTTARLTPAITLSTGRVLAVGGYTSALAVLASCELYDPATGLWAGTGALGTARGFAFLASLPSGRALAVGGLGAMFAAASAACDVYDPTAGAWAAPGALATARAACIALLPNGHVLVAGGAPNLAGGAPIGSCELFLCGVPALTSQAGVASVTALGLGRYRLTLTAAARALLAAGGRHVVVAPASLAQPRDRSAQIQQAQVVATDLTAGTVDVLVVSNPPASAGPSALPFTMWIR